MNQIFIRDVIYSIKFINDKNWMLDGRCNTKTNEIEINSSTPLTEQKETLWHEILHVADFILFDKDHVYTENNDLRTQMMKDSKYDINKILDEINIFDKIQLNESTVYELAKLQYEILTDLRNKKLITWLLK